MTLPAHLEKFTEPIKIGSDGFIRLVDVMGDDSSIVQAARISYGKGTKSVSEDAGLIRYLMRHRHTTPFEMCEIKIHVKVPMDTWRQWIRHRMASVNEYSTRYSVAIDEMATTKSGEWRLQSQGNRQGSEGYLPDSGYGVHGHCLSSEESGFHKEAQRIYQQRITAGVAREQARKDLPLSTYTMAYWKIDLHNLLHFLSLRMDSHAQLEIREYANAIAEIVSKWVPFTWEAFLDYRLNAMFLSAKDIAVISAMRHSPASALASAASFGWVGENGVEKKNREWGEFKEKMERLGIIIPWGYTE